PCTPSRYLAATQISLCASFKSLQDPKHFSVGVFYLNEEIFEGKGGIVFTGSFSKPSGRELNGMMSLSSNYSFSRKTRRMFRRLEDCVKRGASMQEGDWELL